MNPVKSSGPTRTALAEVVAGVEASDLPVVLLTGATGGIGSAAVRTLSQDYVVIAVGRNHERLAALDDMAGPGGVLPLPFDFGQLDEIASVFGRIPRLNALVNAAAIAPRSTLEDASPKDWRDMLDTNVVAPAELTRVLLPILRRTASTENPATVVFLGSGASRAVTPYNVTYAASKHALQAVADGLRQQVAEDNVRVSTVAPGPTDTPMVQWDDDYPAARPQRFIEPESVARAVRHAITAPADAQLTEVWVRPRVEVK